jgi:hypothetical protein
MRRRSLGIYSACILALTGLGCTAEPRRPQACAEVASGVRVRLVEIRTMDLKMFGHVPVRMGMFELVNGAGRSLEFDVWQEAHFSGPHPDSVETQTRIEGDWLRDPLLEDNLPAHSTVRIPPQDKWIFYEYVGDYEPGSRHASDPRRLVLRDARGCSIPSQPFDYR